MRVNPKYSNTCFMQIGMNRTDPCYDCSKLPECDQHYDEKTGEWDYPNPLDHIVPKKSRQKKTGTKCGVGSVCRIIDRKRRSLVERGLAMRLEPRTTLEEAIAKAGL